MPRRFLSERESERGGGLTDPSVNPERDVELEVMLVCEAFFGMEPCVDSLQWIFTGRALGAVPLTRSCLGYMRRPGAPCSSAEHP